MDNPKMISLSCAMLDTCSHVKHLELALRLACQACVTMGREERNPATGHRWEKWYSDFLHQAEEYHAGN
jgi:hypothetical protein